RRVIAFVRDSAAENADIGSASLGRQQRLVKGENRGGVNSDSLTRERIDHAKARIAVFINYWDLHDNIVAPCRERPSLYSHFHAIVGRNFDAKRTVTHEPT